MRAYQAFKISVRRHRSRYEIGDGRYENISGVKSQKGKQSKKSRKEMRKDLADIKSQI